AAEFHDKFLSLGIPRYIRVDPYPILILEVFSADKLADRRILNKHLLLGILLFISVNRSIHLHRILLNALLHCACPGLITHRLSGRLAPPRSVLFFDVPKTSVWRQI